MNKSKRKSLYAKAIEQNGVEIQLCVACEEINELQDAFYTSMEIMGNRLHIPILHDTLIEEVVDVEIMLEQLQHIYAQEIVEVIPSQTKSNIRFQDFCSDFFKASNILSKQRRNKGQEKEIITYVIPTLFTKISTLQSLFDNKKYQKIKIFKLERLQTKLDNKQK